MAVVLAGIAGGCGGSGDAPPAVAPGEAFLFAPEETHFGATYGDWSARWWQWALEVPYAENPLVDQVGTYAHMGQVNPVFFLGGEFAPADGSAPPDGIVDRTVTIPRDNAVFFPIVNSEVDNDFCTPPGWVPLSATGLSNLLNTPRYDVRDVYCYLAGVAIVDSPDGESAQRFRAKSSAFSALMPADNMASNLCGAPFAPILVDPAFSDGLWVMLAPLSPGQHTLTFGGRFAPFPGGWTLDVTYHITVPE